MFKGCLIVILIIVGVLWFWTSGDNTEEKALEYIKSQPELKELIKDADHVDVKTVESKVGLRRFLSSMMTYQPGWVTWLYKVRGVVVRVLGLTQEGIPGPVFIPPQEIPLEKGRQLSFFKVVLGQERSYWVGQIAEKHLRAYLGVIREPQKSKPDKYHVLTVVHYNSWAGPIYFNLIRPFHHLIVKRMAAEGAKGAAVF